MRKIITVIALSTILASCQTIGQDKYLHAGGSALLGIGFSIPLQHSPIKKHSKEASFAACMAVGVAKEIYDEYDYGGFSAGDLVADGLGCAVGVAISEIISGGV